MAVRVWDVNKSEATYCFTDLNKQPNCLTWSPDGKLMCVNELKGAMKVFDIRENNKLAFKFD
jgi:WD40 repeat protein